MTATYNRTSIFNFYELPVSLQAEILEDREESDAYSTSYAVLKDEDNNKIALPLDMFIRTEKNNFTHGIYGQTYFSAYYLTLSKCGTEGVIAYKYF
jgi:hypothetical protein